MTELPQYHFDRDAFVKRMIDNNSCWWDGYNTAKKIFERPQGEWIYRKKGYFNCSFCGKVEMAKMNYCSNCGADMRGGRE